MHGANEDPAKHRPEVRNAILRRGLPFEEGGGSGVGIHPQGTSDLFSHDVYMSSIEAATHSASSLTPRNWALVLLVSSRAIGASALSSSTLVARMLGVLPPLP